MLAHLPPHVAPYALYDSVQPHVLSDILADHPNARVASYTTGGYAADPSSIKSVAHGQTMWIDTDGTKPRANVLDVEPGNIGPERAGEWVKSHTHLTDDRPAIVYTMKSLWADVKADVARDAPGYPVRWWVADPTGTPHMVPGAHATQWYWGTAVDISAADPQLWNADPR